ncbi:MAG: hypothetical protein LCH46_12930 [Proteobacteria bacterium]|nr:hypothetical protein [Pseudomonadota bacterium]
MKKIIAALMCASMSLPLAAVTSTQSFALSKGFCDSYATKKANKKSNKKVVEGLAIGALAGLAIGSVATGSKKGAATGAIIGGVGGTALGGVAANDKWKKTYKKYYKKCRIADDIDELYD